ncbi:MAG: hypothetical protein HC913_12225 [Microscillaceae bacterium]|nr:hypothetical protein [Microscillaceae bacterium]
MTSSNSSAHSHLFSSIRGRLLLLSVVFILALIAIPAIVYWKSTENEQAVLQIEEVGLPIPILTSRLISELNSVAASQRAYLLSADLRFKMERQVIWQKQIAPVRDSLNMLKKKLHRTDLVGRFDSVQVALKHYQKTQEEIDLFFEKIKQIFW